MRSRPRRRQVKDPNFRVQVSEAGVHIYNRDGLHVAPEALALWPRIKDSAGLDTDGGHAFYLGVELARAEIAWQLGKRYVQDQPLNWGVAADRAADDDLDAWCAPGPTQATHAKKDGKPS